MRTLRRAPARHRTPRAAASARLKMLTATPFLCTPPPVLLGDAKVISDGLKGRIAEAVTA